MQKPGQRSRNFLSRATEWFNDLRCMLVAASGALKALGNGVNQVVLICLAFGTLFHKYGDKILALLQ